LQFSAYKAILPRGQPDRFLRRKVANRRLADEYDAAQGRGEVGQPRTRTDLVPKKNGVRAATAADVGLSRKEIHEARQIRDAEKRDPAPFNGKAPDRPGALRSADRAIG
jgi:hypothetical protein